MQVIKSKNGEKSWLGQPTIIKCLEKTLQSTLTPGSPGFVGQKVVDDEDKVTERNKLFTDPEWEHCCISQNILDWILPMQ